MLPATAMMYNLEWCWKLLTETIERKRAWVKDSTVKLQLSLERDVE